MKSKILIIHNILWSHYKGVVFSELYKLAIKEGYDLKVIQIAVNEKGRVKLGDVDKTLHQYPYELLFEISFEETNLFSRSIKLLKSFFKEKPDIVAIPGWYDFAFYLLAFVSKILGKKIILQNDSTYEDRPRKFYKELPKKIIVKLSDVYWCYGTASKKYLLKLGANEEKIFTRCQATVNYEIEKICKETYQEREKIKQGLGLKLNNFIYVGRLSPEKNIKFLLEVFKDIKTSEPKSNDWGLIIVGDGPQKKEIEGFIKENNLEKDIYLAGGVSWKEVPKYYAIADVFILPSLSEPWGLVVNEAMVCGLPVIVSKKAGAYLDLVKEGENGFGFEPTNPQELKAIMLKFINHEVDIKKMGEKSKEIIKDYTPENAARQMLNAVKKVLGEKT